MPVIGAFIGKIETHNKSGHIARSFLLIPQNISFAGRGKLNPSHRSSRGCLNIRTGGVISLPGIFIRLSGELMGFPGEVIRFFLPEIQK